MCNSLYSANDGVLFMGSYVESVSDIFKWHRALKWMKYEGVGTESGVESRAVFENR